MPIKILLVDDEADLRLTLAANLELDGFEVIEADCGEQALEILSRQSVDVVLTDIRMPGINGVELFQAIKRRHPDTPVVLTTAFALEDLVRGALRDGAFTMLPKPSGVPLVIATLTRAARRPAVLIVDGPQGDVRPTTDALNALGVRAATAADEDAALAIVSAGRADVCVIDLQVGRGSSADIVARLRAAGPNVAVIAAATIDAVSLVQRAAAAGAFACLIKPLEPREVAQVVAEARGKPSLQQRSAP